MADSRRPRLVGFLVLTCARLCFGAEPPTPAEQGPLAVETLDLTLVDTTRPTAPNGTFAGAPQRTLEATVWYPVAPGPHPLVVYAHGFMSFRDECRYLARHLASHGYVVISADFPLTGFNAPGGPLLDDVANQPQDLSFLIDRLLAFNEQPTHRLFHLIDGSRIGAAGVSLGGFTATQAGFHRTLHDERIKAVVAIAAPSQVLTPAFFATRPLPYLLIYGDVDRIIEYRANGRGALAKARCAKLVTLHGGAHTSFADIAAYFMWWHRNPDELGCAALVKNLSPEGHNPFAGLGGAENGLAVPLKSIAPCSAPSFPRAMRPGVQQALTKTAALAFFDSQFAETPEARAAAAQYLANDFASQHPTEVAYETFCAP